MERAADHSGPRESPRAQRGPHCLTRGSEEARPPRGQPLGESCSLLPVPDAATHGNACGTSQPPLVKFPRSAPAGSLGRGQAAPRHSRRHTKERGGCG